MKLDLSPVTEIAIHGGAIKRWDAGLWLCDADDEQSGFSISYEDAAEFAKVLSLIASLGAPQAKG